jgi:hypothetical protein
MLAELQQGIATLRETNADRFDPVRFRFIESLVERAITLRGPVQDVVQNKISVALKAYQTDQQSTADHVKRVFAQAPDDDREESAELLRQGDYRRLKQRLFAVGAKPASDINDTLVILAGLRELLDRPQLPLDSPSSVFERKLNEQESASLAGATYTDEVRLDQDLDLAAKDQRPLKASQKMQVFQQRRAVERRVEIAIRQGPESPGPLNPQMLAIKALTSMRDLSPQYLSRYVNYLDALFWLEHAADRPAPAKPANKGRKPVRRK